ncbi:hypothetical protein WB44_03955 [Synechococcus sp. WH 8020]|uniref:hypothetical protein n=1 Tax=Synechococcus sp. (strain WH8020) TaxID=32052 RepID=UPI0006526F91|nr:hypothetical protein [Synechococcus sp. WH 8020]AKN62137.1 hypothetical protein WB44_03955 [Synechococcus sp. WH 8020]
MGLFDRLLKSRSNKDGQQGLPKDNVKAKAEAFYLDSDTSSSYGNVDYMREAKTIRRTFPGSADNPGNKELVTEVDAMDLKVGTRSKGLGSEKPNEEPSIPSVISSGIPTPVKKTFAEAMTKEELDQKLKGNALRTAGVNAPMAPNAAPAGRKEELKSEPPKMQPAPQMQTRTPSSKPGSIDPFKDMVRDLNN